MNLWYNWIQLNDKPRLDFSHVQADLRLNFCKNEDTLLTVDLIFVLNDLLAKKKKKRKKERQISRFRLICLSFFYFFSVNVHSDMCIQQRFTSGFALAQSDQNCH